MAHSNRLYLLTQEGSARPVLNSPERGLCDLSRELPAITFTQAELTLNAAFLQCEVGLAPGYRKPTQVRSRLIDKILNDVPSGAIVLVGAPHVYLFESPLFGSGLAVANYFHVDK